MSFEQLMEHAYEIQQLAVEKYMKRWRANQPGLYAPWEPIAGEAVARERIEREVADIPALFAPFAAIPDPVLFEPMMQGMDRALGKLSHGDGDEAARDPVNLGDAYDANPELAKLSATESWIAKWSGHAAREFKANFIDPFPYIVYNQFHLASVVKGALKAQHEVCVGARHDIDDIAEKVRDALNRMDEGGDVGLSFLFTVVGAVVSIPAAALSGAAAVGLTAVSSAASIAAEESDSRSAAPHERSRVEIQYSGPDVESIIMAMRESITKLKSILVPQQDAIARALRASLVHLQANRKHFVSPRPELTSATPKTVRSRQYLGFAH
jgi:hypothetical protein